MFRVALSLLAVCTCIHLATGMAGIENGWYRVPDDNIAVCSGSTIDLDWKYNVTFQQFLIGATVYKMGIGDPRKLISRTSGKVETFTSIVRPLGNIGIRLLNVTVNDSGIYRCNVVFQKGVRPMLVDAVNVTVQECLIPTVTSLEITASNSERGITYNFLTNSTSVPGTLSTRVIYVTTIISLSIISITMCLVFLWKTKRICVKDDPKKLGMQQGKGDVDPEQSEPLNQDNPEEGTNKFQQMESVSDLVEHLYESLPLSNKQINNLRYHQPSDVKKWSQLKKYLSRFPDQDLVYEINAHVQKSKKLNYRLIQSAVYEMPMQSLDDASQQETLDKFQSCLKEMLLSKVANLNSRIRTSYLSQFKGVFYVDLAISDDKNALTNEYVARTPSFHDFKKRVPLSDILTNLFKTEQNRTVLICGAPGTGKSTVTQIIASKWSKGRLWNDKFYLLFHIECRRLSEYQQKGDSITFVDLIVRSHCQDQFVSDPVLEGYVIGFIDENKDKICFVIDGIDELPGWEDVNIELSEASHMRASVPPITLIKSLIYGHLLPSSTVIFTSRQMKCLQTQQISRTVVVLGFDDEAIDECSFAVCGYDRQLHKSVETFLDGNPYIYAHCVVPFICVMLTTLLRRQDSSPSSIVCRTVGLTQLMVQIVYHMMCKRDKGNNVENMIIPPKEVNTITRLAKLAARGQLAIDRNLVFTSKDLLSCDISLDNPMIRNLLEIHDDDTQYGTVTASFLHLTIQEFLTALHICLSWNFADVAKISLISEKSRTQDIVLLYTAGLLGDKELGHTFLQRLGSRGSMIFNQRLSQLIGEVKDAGKASKLSMLLLIQCYHESRHGDLKKHLRLESSLDLSKIKGGLLPQHLISIGFFIKQMDCLKHIDFSECEITSVAIGALMQGLNPGRAWTKVTELLLNNNRLQKDGINHLAIQFKHLGGMPFLKQLDLSSNLIEDAGCMHIAESLSLCPQLTILRIKNNKIANPGITELGKTILNCKELRELHLQTNNISDTGISKLILGLKECQHLTVLCLGTNFIGHKGAKELAEISKDWKNLQTLELSDNGIKYEGAKAVVDALTKCQSSVELQLTGKDFSTDEKEDLEYSFKHIALK